MIKRQREEQQNLADRAILRRFLGMPFGQSGFMWALRHARDRVTNDSAVSGDSGHSNCCDSAVTGTSVKMVTVCVSLYVHFDQYSKCTWNGKRRLGFLCSLMW